MKIIPMKNKVLIKVSEGEEKTEKGIYIPDTARENKKEGLVIEVGENKRGVKKGDRVIYDGFGTEVMIDDVKHLIVSIKDIVAKIQ